MSTATEVAGSSAASASCLTKRIPLTPLERQWPHRTYSILREVLGPDFHGPSSSHTAAPQLIALDTRIKLGAVPDAATVRLFNSFATTGEGHRTPNAVVAGLLGIGTSDPRTPAATEIAARIGLAVTFEKLDDPAEHPNTIEILVRRGASYVRVKGISIGGGNYRLADEDPGSTVAA